MTALRACRHIPVVARRAAGRRMVRAIARRRNGLVAELLGHFGNAASVRARRRPAGGNVTTGPNPPTRTERTPPCRRPASAVTRSGPTPSSPPSS
ncbi:hypothetical protein F2B00_34640 [Streptomyces parvus]|nr:hypothetical protein F2B00_34640 [Streptomyces parvus]